MHFEVVLHGDAIYKPQGRIQTPVLLHEVVGPGFNEVAQRQSGKTDYLLGKIKTGSVGVYGHIPMPPQTLPEADAQKTVEWISKGANK